MSERSGFTLTPTTVVTSSIVAAEAQEQAAYVRWTEIFRVEVNGRRHPLRSFIVASANGAHLAGDRKARAIQIRKLKDQGLTPGASDLFVSLPAHGFHGLYLEFKRTKGAKPSDKQCAFANLMIDAGYAAAVAYGCDMGMEVTQAYLKGVSFPAVSRFPRIT